ncbi:hypothetical protein [Methylopila sp. 73B]|uniref:hypothetical protein n=1 Tax=Methylopila sp. 73B TaxID=1120792 RepID=UPI000376B995|nr:hypothetical protein [Methylopila sp. 73B]
MTALFLDARFDQCRTPRWTAATPVLEREVCGDRVIPGRTYCAACRETLIAGQMVKGKVEWFNRVGGRPPQDVERDVAEADLLAPDLGSARGSAVMGNPMTDTDADSPSERGPVDEEAEPEGDRPLLLDVLSLRSAGWGMAA